MMLWPLYNSVLKDRDARDTFGRAVIRFKTADLPIECYLETTDVTFVEPSGFPSLNGIVQFFLRVNPWE
jgi:hypothetical protein